MIAACDGTGTDTDRLRLLGEGDIEQALSSMRRAARAAVRSSQDADDLVQDTLVRVLSRPRMVHGEDPTGYLVRAVRNRSVSWHRERARRPETVPLGGEHDAIEARERCEDRIGQVTGWAAVAALPAPFRDAIVAVDLCGLTYHEAAAALGVPAGTIMSRLSRGRRRLSPLLVACDATE